MLFYSFLDTLVNLRRNFVSQVMYIMGNKYSKLEKNVFPVPSFCFLQNKQLVPANSERDAGTRTSP